FDIFLIFFLINAKGKNATVKTITPTTANFQLVHNNTAISPSASTLQVIKCFRESTTVLDAVSGSVKNLVRIMPEEFSSKNFVSIFINFLNKSILTRFEILLLIQSVRYEFK